MMSKLIAPVFIAAALALSACGSHQSLPDGDATAKAQGKNTLPVQWAGDIKIAARLPDDVLETSGLAERDGVVWTINDSGDGPNLYALRGHHLLRKVQVKGARNIDWEDLAQDDEYLYIADCGNNRARRKQVQIYKVSWAELAQSHSVSVESTLNVSYANQPERPDPKNHNYDCEAITVVGDEIWLFSKNRQDENSWLYRLDKNKRHQVVRGVRSLAVDGLITAADYDAKTKRLVLLGYSKRRIFGQSFLWVVPVENGIIWARAKRLTLHPYAQWEAVLWRGQQGDGRLLLSTERNPLLDASMGELYLPALREK